MLEENRYDFLVFLWHSIKRSHITILAWMQKVSVYIVHNISNHKWFLLNSFKISYLSIDDLQCTQLSIKSMQIGITMYVQRLFLKFLDEFAKILMSQRSNKFTTLICERHFVLRRQFPSFGLCHNCVSSKSKGQFSSLGAKECFSFLSKSFHSVLCFQNTSCMFLWMCMPSCCTEELYWMGEWMAFVKWDLKETLIIQMSHRRSIWIMTMKRMEHKETVWSRDFDWLQ